MKLTIFIFFLAAYAVNAQNQLINNGAIIKVENTANLRVDNGGILNKNSGLINNAGNIYLDADFNQTTAASYTGSALSWLWFDGSVNQIIMGDAPLSIAKLRVDNANRLILGNHVNVANRTDLTNNGDIELGNYNLVMATGSTISGYDANNFIVTNGSGYLQREVANSSVEFPVGLSNYNPATLLNTGTTDNFRVRLEDFVRGSYPSGATEISDVVGRAWFIDEETQGGSNVTLTVQWNAANELTAFDRLLSGISHWNGTSWDRPTVWTAATAVSAGVWTQNRSGINSFSPFAVEDIETALPVELLSFNAKRSSELKVEIDWTTVSETNNSGFFVERMFEDESEFTIQAWIDGAGNSTETKVYRLEDDNASQKITYYRLRQIDFDGTESVSEIRAVEGSVKNNSLVLFPNPSKDEAFLLFGELDHTVKSAQIELFDIRGVLISEFSAELRSFCKISINNSQLLPGNYFIRILYDNGTSSIIKLEKI
jgi:hypothetical protein